MLTCPYCNHKLVPIGVRFGWPIARCATCGSIACTKDVPSGVLAKLYLDPTYYKGGGQPYGYEDIDAHHNATIPIWAERLSIIEKRTSGRRLLEVGPGRGGFLSFASSCGWVVTGVEPFPTTEYAAVVVGTLDAARSRGPFDAICLFDVLEHVSDPLVLLKDIVEHLAPCGCIAIGLPCVSGPSFRQEGIDWREVKPPEHLSLPSSAGMRALFSRCDLIPFAVRGHFIVPWTWQSARRIIDVLRTSWRRPFVADVAIAALRLLVRSVEDSHHSLRSPHHEEQDYVTWFAVREMK